MTGMELACLMACVGVFIMGSRFGKRYCHRRLWLVSYAAPVVFALLALSLAASARGDDIYTSEAGIWQTESGVYTDMPHRYAGESKRVVPSYKRWTPVVDSTPLRRWAASVAVRVAPSSRACVGVFLGNSAASGGATVCRGERAVVRQERVRRRGSIVTTTDAVLLVGGREVMRIEGRSHEHDPRKIRRLK